jgi:hypothetical protein
MLMPYLAIGHGFSFEIPSKLRKNLGHKILYLLASGR